MAPSAYLMGAVQMTSSADRARNLEVAVRLVEEAADLGARLVALPENFSYMGPEEGRIAGAEPLEGPTLGALRELARRRGIFIVAGLDRGEGGRPAPHGEHLGAHRRRRRRSSPRTARSTCST